MDSLHGNFSDCPNGSQWVWEIFSECARDGRDIASVVLGLVSIVCFAAAAFPQFYQACKTGIMDQALSIYFLLGWLGGDLLNFIGSLLANQLPLQVYTAIYYVLADLLMISLYLYYKIKNQNRGFSAPINAAFAFVLLGTVSTTFLLGGPAPPSSKGMHVFQGRLLLSIETDETLWEPFTKKEIVGFVIGSVSSLLYLLSRVPQIYTNFKRKSTTGISYSLFALVMLGNTLYGVSVLLKNPDLGQSEGSYVIHHLPWLIGSLGVLSLDVFISLQFLAYRQPTPPLLEERDALLGKQEEPLDS
ncbi:lysosomal amino acid transporter 1 homolog [Eublepharis macularius]|uniref:Lysosomal amino acid transporter 1 homolog n=1 Tax=Eublepharis macularius TaxID=481883 RepID=A0AA97KK22_EUBMA|nr:lysosomal amino acid transporter 1 homolog [Eublepharis macularius]XP_054857301.1 lysosomal amino acid transporter 1 homolog [Eublepharis macularius]XP_054857302.1 lysosomal amino acid transporter 1 homolog [Eublepharis macularius]